MGLAMFQCETQPNPSRLRQAAPLGSEKSRCTCNCQGMGWSFVLTGGPHTRQRQMPVAAAASSGLQGVEMHRGSDKGRRNSVQGIRLIEAERPLGDAQRAHRRL